MTFANNISLNNNELQNVLLQKLAADPTNITAKVYYNTVSNTIRYYNGSVWQSLGTGAGSGDVVGPASSVDQQIALFDGTTGKLLEAATVTGVLKATSGVLAAAVAGTDYLAPAAIGVTVQGYDATLAALAALNGTAGMVVQTAADTFTKRTLTGTTNRIVITNGDGVSGNPTFDIGSDVVTASSTHTFTNKTFDANGTGNSISNLETADFAANVIDNDAALTANSSTRIATQQAVKGYVDNAIAGVDWKESVRVATTAAGTLATSFANGQTVDGITLTTGDRILIKNQSTQTENGIYVVTAGAPTRATDADTGSEIWSAAVYVRQGTANAGTNWVNNNTSAITIGVTNITFAQFQGQVQPDATTTTKGIVELATQTEAEAKSSTTVVLTPASIVNFTQKRTFTIGDNSATSFTLTHNLNTQDITVSIRKVSNNEQWFTTTTCNSVNQVTLTFAVAPTTNEFVVTVIG